MDERERLRSIRERSAVMRERLQAVRETSLAAPTNNQTKPNQTKSNQKRRDEQ